MKEFDLVSVGDTLIDIFLRINSLSDDLHLDHANEELQIRIGSKIPIDTSVLSLGGDACNVAVSAARLGLRSAIMAEIGDDDFAAKITRELHNDGVNQDYLIQTKNASSTFSVIITVTNDRTIFSRHMEREHKFSFNGLSTEWIYLTSLGKKWREAYRHTIDYVKKNQVKLAFSPGSHQLKEGRESFSDVLFVTDMLFLNREEGEKVAYGHEWDMQGERKPIEQVLHDLQKLGPKVVSITDGVNGSYAINAKGEVFSEGIIASEVVEKTGVGDAYAAGFLASILHGRDITQAMKWGAINSAAVIGHIGSVTGLVSLKDLEERVRHI